MLTVKKVSELTGVSIRTLHYYDSVGLLPPSSVTDAGYRLYDSDALRRLQEVMLLRELEFSVADIRKIVTSEDFDREQALTQQIELLELKKEHIDRLITFAKTLKTTGVNSMDFKAFDKTKQKEYAQKAKERWGNTDAYKEYEKKSAGISQDDSDIIVAGLMDIFRELGEARNGAVSDALPLVEKLKGYITKHYYTCTNEILSGLGQMYAAGGEMTDNIDKAGGEGTAVFAKKAIDMFCDK